MKKSRLLCMILTAAMLFSMPPAIALPATAEPAATLPLEDANGRPLYLPDHRVEDESNDKDGVWWVGYDYRIGAKQVLIGYNNGTEINKAIGRVSPLYSGVVPLGLQGQAMRYTSIPISPISAEKVGTVEGNQSSTLSNAVEIPNDAVGFLVKVTAKGDTKNTAIQFNPTVTDVGTEYTASSNINNYQFAYIWDGINEVWSASLAERAYRIPANSDGGVTSYLYLPFEIYRYSYTNAESTKVENATLDIQGMRISAFHIGVIWDGAEVTLEELQIVSATSVIVDKEPYLIPSILPDLDGTDVYLAGYHYPNDPTSEDDQKEDPNRVFSHYAPYEESCGGLHYNTAVGFTNTVMGRLKTENVIIKGQTLVPALTQGQKYTLQTVYDQEVTAVIEEEPRLIELSSVSEATVPLGATGIMLRVRINKGNNNNSGFCFNPKFDFADDQNCRTVKGAGGYIFYYDAVNKNWRASAAEHAYRVPDDFDGYVYIPFETYQKTTNNGDRSQIEDPHLMAEDLQGRTMTSFCWEADWNSEEVALLSVSYVVLPTIKDTSLAIDNSLNFNLYVQADESFVSGGQLTVNFLSAEDRTIVYYSDTVGEPTEAAREVRFTFPDMLPQSMDTELIFQLCSDGRPVSEKVVSVVDYCQALVDDDNQSKAVHDLAADILKYGQAAQVIAGIEDVFSISNPSGYGAQETGRTATVIKGITTPLIDNKKIFKNVRLRLDTEIALQLDLALDTKRNVKVEVTLGDRTVVYSNGGDGDFRLTNSILFDVMAHEFDEKITAVIYVNGVENQTLIYSVNRYLADYNAGNAWDAYNEWDQLMDALYAYGVSAREYAEENKRLQAQETYKRTSLSMSDK